MNDDKGRKIDINGSVSDSVKGVASDAFGMLVVLIALGWLVAPIFLPLFQDDLDRKYRDPYGNVDSPRVAAEMEKIRRILWIACLIGWALLIFWNIYPAN